MSDVTMNYHLLGRSGLRVSELCLGTMTFGEEWGWGASRDEARRIYEAYRGAGGNFIDTANVYTNGTSETFVGEFISGHRDEIVLATRLHIWDAMTPAEEVMHAFDDLVRAGKVLYVGISDAPAWVVAQSNTLADLRGWTPYVGLQLEYSLLERTVERELLPMAADFGLSVLAWSPLRNGVLSGKYLSENADGAANGRMNAPTRTNYGQDDPAADAVVRETVAVANEVGVSAAQIALAWLRARPSPIIPIVGARKLTQLEDNLRSLNVVLSSEQLERLDRISAAPLGFPQNYYMHDAVRTMIYGGMRDRIQA
jgi:aryl-alcohol dehydrogenase-like predicted oxidoreductase